MPFAVEFAQLKALACPVGDGLAERWQAIGRGITGHFQLVRHQRFKRRRKGRVLGFANGQRNMRQVSWGR